MSWEELIAFPFQSRRGNKQTQLMQWLGQRLWDIPVSSEPSRNVSYNSGQKGRVPEKNLEVICQKWLFFHHTVESIRVVVLKPPQSHLPTSLLAQL